MDIEDLIIKKDNIKDFYRMVNDIKLSGKTSYCPSWNYTLVKCYRVKKNCLVCGIFFPKTMGYFCPCNHYSKSTLLLFLNTIIKQSEAYHDRKNK